MQDLAAEDRIPAPAPFLALEYHKGLTLPTLLQQDAFIPMETTTAGKNDLEQRNSTLESDFISTRRYFRAIIGDVGPRKLYSGCNSLLPMQHGIALKGCSSGGLHSVMISTVAC